MSESQDEGKRCGRAWCRKLKSTLVFRSGLSDYLELPAWEEPQNDAY